MLIFSNPCTGKSEAIINLELNGFEINNRLIFEHLKAKDYEWIAECVNQIAEAEPDRILMSMYLDNETMGRILRRVDNERVIICGHDVDYQETIKHSIHCRYLGEIKIMGDSNYVISKDRRISDSWADIDIIKGNFKKFNYYKGIYPDCTFIQLKPGQYLTDVLREPLKDYIKAKREGLSKLRKQFPYVL